MALHAPRGLTGDILLSFKYYIPADVIDRSTQLSSSCQSMKLGSDALSSFHHNTNQVSLSPPAQLGI